MRTDKITINTLAGGWQSDFAKGSFSSPTTKQGQYYLGFANFNKPSYLGQISSAFGQNPTTMSSVTLPINGTIASNNLAHVILANGLIKTFDVTSTFSNTSIDYTAPTGCITGNNKDIWKHVDTSGNEIVMFTWQDGGVARLGYAKVGAIGTIRTDNYFAFSNYSAPHVGCVSVGNQSFITDGQYLQRYDPNSASPTALRVNMGTGWTIVSVVDAGNYVACVGNNGVTSRLWLCNGTDVLPTFQYDIRDTTATAIINEGGVLKVFTYGKNGTTKIKIFDGNGFSEEADWEIPTSLCASPSHNMVDIWLNQIVWRSQDGYIWSYGSSRKNEVLSGAHKIGYCTTDTNTQGMVKNLYQNQLYVGITNASNSYVYNVKADESYGAILSSNIRTALYETPRNATIQKITVYFSNFVQSSPSYAGSSFSMKLYKDYDTSTDLLTGLGTVPQTVNGGENLYYYHIKASISNLSTFFLDMTFSSCTIRKIVVTYVYEENDL